MEQSFIAYIENSIKQNWDLDALTDYNGATLQYKDVARKIEKVHLIFEASGIKKGDKIAICGRNSSHWGVTFLATLTYGAVAVPILHEFKADNIHNIVNHSEAKLLFVGDQVWENLNEAAMTILEGIILMTDFSILISRTEKLDYAREHLNELFGKKYPKNFRKEHIELAAARIAQGFQDKLYLGNLDARRDWGYAKDYVECMWLILQHDTPEDFVIATGEMHTVREFATLAFKEVGIELRWEGEGVEEKGIDVQTGKTLVEIDPKYFRPAEVEQLLGNPTKAKTLLGWNPRQTSFEELVKIMAAHDMKFVKKLYLRSLEK